MDKKIHYHLMAFPTTEAADLFSKWVIEKVSSKLDIDIGAPHTKSLPFSGYFMLATPAQESETGFRKPRKLGTKPGKVSLLKRFG